MDLLLRHVRDDVLDDIFGCAAMDCLDGIFGLSCEISVAMVLSMSSLLGWTNKTRSPELASL